MPHVLAEAPEAPEADQQPPQAPEANQQPQQLTITNSTLFFSLHFLHVLRICLSHYNQNDLAKAP